MKKFVVLMVAFVVMFTGLTFGGAFDTIDLASIGTDDLIELRNAINEELKNRVNIENDYIYSGEYIVGKDIAPGRYLFTNLEDDGFGKFAIYDTYVPSDEQYMSDFKYADIDVPINIVLEEDNLFVIYNCSKATIVPYTPSWSLN